MSIFPPNHISTVSADPDYLVVNPSNIDKVPGMYIPQAPISPIRTIPGTQTVTQQKVEVNNPQEKSENPFEIKRSNSFSLKTENMKRVFISCIPATVTPKRLARILSGVNGKHFKQFSQSESHNSSNESTSEEVKDGDHSHVILDEEGAHLSMSSAETLIGTMKEGESRERRIIGFCYIRDCFGSDRGMAFVEFTNEKDAEMCVQELDTQMRFHDSHRPLHVKLSGELLHPCFDNTVFDRRPHIYGVKLPSALWQMCQDEKTGHTYYFHSQTGDSEWQKPQCLIEDSDEE